MQAVHHRLSHPPHHHIRHSFVILFHDHNSSRHCRASSRHIMTSLRPMRSQCCILSMHSFPLCFIFSSRLTRLADPALVISVLTNRMQYRPHSSPQSHSTWSGVDAGVLGHIRRFDENLLFSSLTPVCLSFIILDRFTFVLPFIRSVVEL